MATLKLGSTTAISESSGALTIASSTLTTPTIASMANCTFPAGHVLQTLYVQKTTGSSSTTSTTFRNYTNLVLTITPSSTSSKIFILGNAHLYINGSDPSGWNAGNLRILQTISGGSDVEVWKNTTDNDIGFGRFSTDTTSRQMGWSPIQYLDYPSTTSAITYQIQYNSVQGDSMAEDGAGNGHSDLMLQEIAQ